MKRNTKKLGEELAISATPQLWANIANRGLRGGPQLTPWFPATDAPVRVGWYERFVFNDVVFHFWDGYSWLLSPGGAAYDRELKSFWPCWRGLSEEGARDRQPKKTRMDPKLFRGLTIYSQSE
jgi:hypothetical protein